MASTVLKVVNSVCLSWIEMESSSLAGLSALMGHRALTICCIIAGRKAKNMNTDYKSSLENLIDLVLDRI